MTLIQYIIVRSDLIKKLNWPLGNSLKFIEKKAN